MNGAIRSGRRDWRGLSCAALLGAAIAFPLGLIVGAGEPPRESPRSSSRPAPPGGEPSTGRNLYSPRIVGDPYVIEQQRKVLRALETSCRRLKQHCAEAEQARRVIQEAEAAR